MASDDTIASSGFPLAFRVRDGEPAGTVGGRRPTHDVFRVQARMMGMGGHQKEALVSEGQNGPVWRMVSDEGANLKGTDLAPFPLAFFNVGLISDFANRVLTMAASRGIGISLDELRLVNRFRFTGSFYRGTGEGTAEAIDLRVAAQSTAPSGTVSEVLADALLASPAHAAMATALRNTFALYVNGRRREVVRVASSASPDEPDPFLANRAPPVPLDAMGSAGPIIEALPADPAAGVGTALAAEGALPIEISGTGTLEDTAGLVDTTVVSGFPGARFRLRSDERPRTGVAPSGLAYVAAGIAFCYMTQLARYIEYRKHKVRALRLVQTLPFALRTGVHARETLGSGGPVDTHLFVHADEPDEVMQNLLQVAENTCYLHAALRTALPGRATLLQTREKHSIGESANATSGRFRG